jgi:hypothetical protein
MLWLFEPQWECSMAIKKKSLGLTVTSHKDVTRGRVYHLKD